MSQSTAEESHSPIADGPHSLTFVTVSFEAEMTLLRLQARSMARFVPGPLVASIIVIDNTDHGMSQRERDRLLRCYGWLAPLVRVMRPSDIVDTPPAAGWVRQQILKLAVSAAITTPQYVVLDAKNHFVAPPAPTYFVSPDGRACTPTYSYVDHPLRDHLERTLRYLDLPVDENIADFSATITPFVFDTKRVREMVTGVERRAGQPFADEFVERGLTEFFLYSAWILAEGETLDDVFDRSQVRCPVVWPRQASVAGIRAAVTQASELDSPIFSVHRRALATLDRAATRELAEYWTGTGLFASRADARRFVRSFQVMLLLAHARRRLGRLRDRPG